MGGAPGGGGGQGRASGVDNEGAATVARVDEACTVPCVPAQYVGATQRLRAPQMGIDREG